MEPIVPIIDKTKEAPRRGTLADRIAAGLASLSALIALGYSLFFFTRFLENDTHIWGIVSAFVLCFGVGALAYGPAGIIAHLAWRAHKEGASRKGLLWVIVLLLPWVFLSLALVFISDLPMLYSLPILVTVLLLLFWAVVSLRKVKV